MKNTLCRYGNHTCMIIALLFIFAGCRKNTGSASNNNNNNTPPSEFFVTAKVDGQDWSANVKDGDYDVSAGTSGQQLIILGVQAKNGDSSALVLSLPKKPLLNTVRAFDPLQQSVAGFITASASYRADPANNGSGTYSVTSMNDSSKVVEGNFQFVARLTTGTGNGSVNVTDGKFKAVYRTNYSPAPPINLKK